MLQTSAAFKENAIGAMADAGLQRALARSKPQFVKKRQMAVDRLPEFEALREEAKNIKNHAIANLDFYLESYAAAVEASGGTVHWCATPEDARQAVLKICRAAGAKTVTKGKSMVTEEIALNEFLEANGVTPVETDLGEYIIQLRHESPSHIIAPAFHLNREDWEESFRKSHTDLPADRIFRERRDILTEARGKLREKFLTADVGITGANFLIAETGSSVIVTNEGNGDLTQTLPRVHVVVTGRWCRRSRTRSLCSACWHAPPRGRICPFIRRFRPGPAALATLTGRRNIMWCCWITGAPAWWGRNFRICCAVYAVRPA
jgi:L-lactate dehydrogenase complex protein LldF